MCCSVDEFAGESGGGSRRVAVLGGAGVPQRAAAEAGAALAGAHPQQSAREQGQPRRGPLPAGARKFRAGGFGGARGHHPPHRAAQEGVARQAGRPGPAQPPPNATHTGQQEKDHCACAATRRLRCACAAEFSVLHELCARPNALMDISAHAHYKISAHAQYNGRGACANAIVRCF